MVCFEFKRILCKLLAMECGRKCECLIKYKHKIVLEISRHASAVLGGIPNDLTFGRNDLYVRSFVESIQQHICTVCFRKCETELCCPFCGCNLCCHIIIGEVYFVIMWLCDFGFVGKPA